MPGRCSSQEQTGTFVLNGHRNVPAAHVPSWGPSAKTVGERDMTELLADFPPLLDRLKYIMDCTFSWYSFPSKKHQIQASALNYWDFDLKVLYSAGLLPYQCVVRSRSWRECGKRRCWWVDEQPAGSCR